MRASNNLKLIFFFTFQAFFGCGDTSSNKSSSDPIDFISLNSPNFSGLAFVAKTVETANLETWSLYYYDFSEGRIFPLEKDLTDPVTLFPSSFKKVFAFAQGEDLELFEITTPYRAENLSSRVQVEGSFSQPPWSIMSSIDETSIVASFTFDHKVTQIDSKTGKSSDVLNGASFSLAKEQFNPLNLFTFGQETVLLNSGVLDGVRLTGSQRLLFSSSTNNGQFIPTRTVTINGSNPMAVITEDQSAYTLSLCSDDLIGNDTCIAAIEAFTIAGGPSETLLDMNNLGLSSWQGKFFKKAGQNVFYVVARNQSNDEVSLLQFDLTSTGLITENLHTFVGEEIFLTVYDPVQDRFIIGDSQAPDGLLFVYENDQLIDSTQLPEAPVNGALGI